MDADQHFNSRSETYVDYKVFCGESYPTSLASLVIKDHFRIPASQKLYGRNMIFVIIDDESMTPKDHLCILKQMRTWDARYSLPSLASDRILQ